MGLGCLLSAPVHAQERNDKPVLMQADKLGYDQENQIAVALGNVEVSQGDSVLYADRITYYQQQNVVRAHGNVIMMDPTGQVYFSEQAQVTGDLKRGVINNLRTKMADNSRFAARQAVRKNENQLTLERATYSPCELCEGSEDPLWQLKAEEIEIDQEDQSVTYDNAWLEVWGVPVLYTPYLSHPTPGADRKSGFLTPDYGSSSNLGSIIKVPFYWNIAPDKDATITSYFTSEEGPVLELEYRQLFEKGQMEFRGSGTFPDERDGLTGARTGSNEFRGHVFAAGNGEVTEHWNWGFNLERATDDTYLRRYGFGDQDTLQSRVQFDRIEGRSYVQAQSLTFQGLEIDDDPDRTPLILPLLSAEYESDPWVLGSRWRVGGNAMALTRTLGSDTNRLSSTLGWNLPLISNTGNVFDVDAQVRADYYNIDDNTVGAMRLSENVSRVLPRLGVSWRYPLVNHMETGSAVIEPTIVGVVGSRGHNPAVIPNEDALVTDFNDLNIFAYDRFPGLDRYQEGSRVTYGLRSQWSGYEGETLTGMFGQSYRMEQDAVFPDNNTPGEKWSDYIGSLGIDYMPVSIGYRFRLDQKNFSPTRHEVVSGYTEDWFSVNVNYLKLRSDSVLADREDISFASTMQLTNYWKLKAGGARDIEQEQSRNAFVSLIYEDECITLTTLALRDFTRDRDVEPSDQYLVNVILRNVN